MNRLLLTQTRNVRSENWEHIYHDILLILIVCAILGFIGSNVIKLISNRMKKNTNPRNEMENEENNHPQRYTMHIEDVADLESW